jgi:hypothetical protein
MGVTASSQSDATLSLMRVAILSQARRSSSPKESGLPDAVTNDHGLGAEVKMQGQSLKRDGLSPIPTDHRDGLGTALRPPFFFAKESAVHYGTRRNWDGKRIFPRMWSACAVHCMVSVE